jgi:hypothetical protein
MKSFSPFVLILYPFFLLIIFEIANHFPLIVIVLLFL